MNDSSCKLTCPFVEPLIMIMIDALINNPYTLQAKWRSIETIIMFKFDHSGWSDGILLLVNRYSCQTEYVR